ncbi:MAG: hypothetical protein KJZ84_04880 [Bryobacteraceae bacterium]|nr:hypothetical protein [Bryobacteraceae bacterium]
MPAAEPASRYPALLLAVAVLVSVLSISGLLRSYRTTGQLAASSRDPYGVELAMRRFAPARRQLPAGARVAYFTDVPLNTEAGVAAFLAAQHALAPCLLVDPSGDQSPAWGAGNFSRPQPYEQPGYRVIADLGNGVILYRREERR